MSERFVDVLVDIPHIAADQLFTYKTPSAWGDLPRLGARVIVPFGNRQAEAVVWRESQSAEREKVKEILEVLDEEPLLSRERLGLCDWLAGRYLSSRLDALHLFLPPGMHLAMEKMWRPTGDAEALRKRLHKLEIEQTLKEKILNLVEEAAVTNRPIVRGTNRELDKTLSLLAAEGYLQAEWRPRKSRINPKTERVVVLGQTQGIRLTAQQQTVVDFLKNNSPSLYNLRRLSQAAGVGEGVIRRLVERGVLNYRQIRLSRAPADHGSIQPPPVLTPEQASAYERVLPGISAGRFQNFLLHGVTGSGKTEVYLRLLAEIIRLGKQGIFLVPEIALTPQTMERVRLRLGDRAAILHSRLSDGERYDQWWRIFRGEVDVVVGARSALFAPLQRIGLIILDEEHEYSYKQEESPRYQTREVAREICRRFGATLLLGSATPSLESWRDTLEGDAIKLELTKRVGERPLPSVETVDMRRELKERHFGVLSRRLRAEIAETLARKEQIILLLNRRGFATFVLCRECGHVMNCPQCDVSLTFHQNPPQLKCHYCGHLRKPPDVCPKCKSRYIRFFGQGTQRLEDEVRRLYPEARVERMDLDTTGRKGAHEAIYRNLVERRTDILIGTQMVAKGLDIPGVTLVGVVAADASLNIPDFRASERTFQLLTQVAGRAGRGESPGKVVIQTYNPEHYCIASVVSGDMESFYNRELRLRRENFYPPFTNMIRIGFSGTDGRDVIRSAQAFAERLAVLRQDGGRPIEVLGPAPAAIERLKGRVRWQLILKGEDLSLLLEAANSGILAHYKRFPRSTTRLIPDVNPYSLF